METTKTILIAGGSGLIGSALKDYFSNLGNVVKILSRQKTDISIETYHWNPTKGEIDLRAFKNVHSVINLSGASILGGRWTNERKQKLRSSRIESTRFLIQQLAKHSHISNYIQSSAMGYYGNRGSEVLFEDSNPGSDFMAQLCIDWENEAQAAKEFTNLSILRIGLYLHKNAMLVSVLQKLSTIYLAAGLGSGKQYVNYTHTDEFNKLVQSLINGEITAGVYNAVGIKACTLDELIAEIVHQNKRKVLLPNVPAFLLKLILGEASAALLSSTRIESMKLKGMNFHIHNSISEAIASINQK